MNNWNQIRKEWIKKNSNNHKGQIEKIYKPTQESLLATLLPRLEDKGFFEEILLWLKTEAPKKIYGVLKELSFPMHTGPVAYDRLCEVVYHLGFRTNERIEQWMMLGPNNQWVREYFNDFPRRT